MNIMIFIVNLLFVIHFQIESVDLALKLLDGYIFRGKEIRVEKAKFTMRGEKYDPSLKPKKKKRKDKEKIKKIQEKYVMFSILL